MRDGAVRLLRFLIYVLYRPSRIAILCSPTGYLQSCILFLFQHYRNFLLSCVNNASTLRFVRFTYYICAHFIALIIQRFNSVYSKQYIFGIFFHLLSSKQIKNYSSIVSDFCTKYFGSTYKQARFSMRAILNLFVIRFSPGQFQLGFLTSNFGYEPPIIRCVMTHKQNCAGNALTLMAK